VLQPTGGRARVAGYDVVTDAAAVRRHVGFLSANTGVYDRMTAWEFVQYFGRLYGLAADVLSRRMEQVFATLQMNDFRDVLGAKMSTGMKQKVSIARTIIHDPPVLVFDEPTAGLDVLVARNVLQSILDLRAQGKCILFSTHVMHEVEKLCDQVAIIHRGKVLAAGSLDTLRREFREDNVEELFYQLIQNAEDKAA
jgi:sodium transport system ATP-binding protein